MDDTPRPDAAPDAAPDEPLDFGPGGYLPERASKRARKIVLRAPMGIQWVIGSLVVGVVVIIAGALALGGDDEPQPPFVQVIAIDDPGIMIDGGRDIMVVNEGGRPRAFDSTDVDPPRHTPLYCRESGLLEADSGLAWRVTGRGVDGTPSLTEHPVALYDGFIWVDPTTDITPAEPETAPVERGCS